MKCQDSDLNRLWSEDDTSPEYRQCVAHIDHCPQCQEELDAILHDDTLTQELSQTLRAAEAEDLQVPQNSFPSPPDIEFESDIDAYPPSPVAEAWDLDFLQPAAHPELLGRLGRYDIERVIGHGGMGVVFRAYDSELHRVVALKVLGKHLTTTAAARQRFAREARAAAAVLHPNVLPIHDVEASGPTPYLVMQYVSGCSLQTRVDRDGPLAPADAMRIAKQTCEALAAAHHQGLIHRDVKPANILLEEGTDRVVLGDFGLARTANDASLTRTGIVAGTPHYMSPEQASGEYVSARSDLFALGSVLYFMLAGRPPFRGESAMSVLNCVCTKKHVSLLAINPSVPRELSEVVDRLLAKKPNGRFANAEVVAQRLEVLYGSMQSGNLRIGPNGGMGKWMVRVAALAAAVCCIAIAWNGMLDQWESDGSLAVVEAPTRQNEQIATLTAGGADGLDVSPPSETVAFESQVVQPPSSVAIAPLIRSTSDRIWDSWERDLIALEQKVVQEELGSVSEGRLLSILSAPDLWADELDALARQIEAASRNE